MISKHDEAVPCVLQAGARVESPAEDGAADSDGRTDQVGRPGVRAGCLQPAVVGCQSTKTAQYRVITIFKSTLLRYLDTYCNIFSTGPISPVTALPCRLTSTVSGHLAPSSGLKSQPVSLAWGAERLDRFL